MKTMTVFGSHGAITVDSETGAVLTRAEHRSEAYADISCFDVDEWKRAYPEETPAGRSIDIMDIGYWHPGGYEEPCEEWRQRARDGQQCIVTGPLVSLTMPTEER